MLSTRLTGSSTSMTVVSLRSAASTAVSAPGCAKRSVEGGGGVVIKEPSVIEQLAHGPPAAVEEYRRVLLDGVLAWHAGRRWVPVVAAQYLVAPCPDWTT